MVSRKRPPDNSWDIVLANIPANIANGSAWFSPDNWKSFVNNNTTPLTYWAFSNEFVGEFVGVGLLRASILAVTEDRPNRPVNSVVICQENGYPYNSFPTRVGSFEQDEITSNQLLTSENLQVFPNPASAVLHIASQGLELDGIHYAIRTSDGRSISRGQLNKLGSIDVSSLAAGYYVLTILNANQQQVNRSFVIRR